MRRRRPILLPAIAVAAAMAAGTSVYAASGLNQVPATHSGGGPRAVDTPPTPPVTATGPLPAVKLTRVRGQVTGGFQVSPPRITDTIEPGIARDYGITVFNQTGHRRRFQLELRDLTPGRGESYADLAEVGTAERGSGGWANLRASSVDLDNLQQAIVVVRIKVPPDADAGGHYAGVRVTSSDPAQTGDVTVKTAIVAHLVTIVPGDVRYELGLSDVQAPGLVRGRARVRVTVTNNGNIHSSPKLRLVLKGPLLDHEVVTDVPEILPGGERPMTLTWNDVPRLGRAQASLRVTGEDGVTQRASAGSIWIWSAAAAIALVVLVVVLALALWWWRRERALQRLIELFGDTEPDL